MVLVPYFVQNLAAASLSWDLFIGGKDRYMSLGAKIKDTNIFYLFYSNRKPGENMDYYLFFKCVLHRLVELTCARSVLYLPKCLLDAHGAEMSEIHKEINYITACIHFAAIAHEQFGHVYGSRVSEELKAMMSTEREWDERLVARIQDILDIYNVLCFGGSKITTHQITTYVMSADGSPFVCTVTQYVANLLDAFVKHKTDNEEIIPFILDSYFPRDTVCIGRAFLHRLALVTLKLKSVIVPHVGANEKRYLDVYTKFFRKHKYELEEKAKGFPLEIVGKLFPNQVVVLDD